MPQDWIGKTIGGRYVIEALLGQGGMSAVYRATDPNLRRPVAIKLIHPHLSTDPNFVGRFKEEAAAVARLRHSRIVQVHDFDVDNGTYYMVMEFLVGETLQKRLRRLNQTNRFMPVEEALKCTIQLCEAAGYAHNRDLVHRDIKPANIMLTVEGQAVLTDFGIVKIIGGDYHTATGATLGTAMYMSPEQIRTERVDARADIYSLGVTLYEMLSGKPPYTANSAMTLMMMVLNDPLPDLGAIRKGLPERLLRVVEKALAKDPATRYQTMDEMAADLLLVESEYRYAPPEPAETLVDEPQSEPETRPEPAAETLRDLPEDQPAALPPSSPPQEQFESVHKISSVATVMDSIEGQERPPVRPAKPEKRFRGRLKPRRATALILIVLLLGFAAVSVFRILAGNQAPNLDLVPIRKPSEAIGTDNAQFVVNLGSWVTDDFIEALTYSPKGALLSLAGNRDASAPAPDHYDTLVLDVEAGETEGIYSEHSGWINDVVFSPDGQRISSVSDDGSLLTWQLNNGSLVRRIDSESGGLTSVAVSPNGLLLAAGSWDGDVYLWEEDTGGLLRTFRGDDFSIFDIDFSPDGRLLAGGSDTGTVIIWNVSDGSVLRILQGHTQTVNRVVFSLDGELLASASDDHEVRIWRVSDGSLLEQFSAHQEVVRAIAFSPDGSLVVSGSDDGALYLWLPADGIVLLALAEDDSLTDLAFSPDGTLLISATADGMVQFWGISEALPQE